MSTAVQLRRGTTAQHAGFTGAVGEVTVDTDKDALVVHDGATAGGFPTAKEAAIGARKAATVGGTVDAITATFSPAFVSLAAAAGYVLAVPLTGANTIAGVTIAIDGLVAKTVVKGSDTALAVGDIPGADTVGLFVYDASLDKFQLLNPYQASSSSAVQIQPISATVAANALTISAPSLTLDFRSTTLSSGTITTVTGDPADLVVSSGSTLGMTNGVETDLAVLALNNAGAIELAVVNMAGGLVLSEIGLISTTAEGGAGAADSASTAYSTTARTNVAYRIVGFLRITEATAGVWATAPSLIQGASESVVAKTLLGANGSAPVYACRAWVNFNGTGTVAIRASGNVSSITDNGTGDYTVNFTSAMSDANYSAPCSSSEPSNVSLASVKRSTTPTASAVNVSSVVPSSGTLLDATNFFVAIFR